MQKSQKIDLNTDYPCPCRRRGRLIPIALTEALGCDRCQQIFVVEEGGYVIEQLSTHYPYKQAWRWSGHQWHRARAGLQDSYLPLALTILMLPIVWLVLVLIARPDMNLVLVMIPLVLILMIPLMQWLAYRR